MLGTAHIRKNISKLLSRATKPDPPWCHPDNNTNDDNNNNNNITEYEWDG